MGKKTADLLFGYLRNIFYGKYDAVLNKEEVDAEFAQVSEGLVYLAQCLSECDDLARCLANGDIHATPPSQQNELAS